MDEFRPCLSYDGEWSRVGDSMSKSKPPKDRKELLRRRKIRDSWTPERRAAQSSRQRKECATPEGYARMSAASKKGWTRQRKATASARMTKLRSNPDFNRKLIVAIKKAKAEPEERARTIAQLRKMNADPELNARRLTGLRKVKSSPESRKRQSALSKSFWADPENSRRTIQSHKNFWADVRALRAAQKAAAKTSRGRPSLSDRNSTAIKLRELGWSYREIAKKLDPEFAKSPAAATETVRSALRRMKRSKKQETPA